MTANPSLFDWTPPPLPSPDRARAFDGATYDHRFDYERLQGQLKAVFDLMSDQRWRTLSDIGTAVEGSEASLSARLRDLRKQKYGAHQIQRESVGGGLFRYRMVME